MTSSTRSISSTKQQLTLSSRLLFPNLSQNNQPPLLLSPNSQVLSNELYHLIALSLRAYITPWWSKITRYDKQFLPEINSILTSFIRALEARVVSTDLSPLLFYDLPILITQHYRDFRNASSKLSTSYAVGGSSPLHAVFHQLQPHIAIPSDTIDEVYIRQVVDHILKTCLPAKDYAPEAERFIVREVVVKVLLQDVVPKITEPWFLHKFALDLLGPPAEDIKPIHHSPPPSTFTFHALLIFFLSAVQIISGTCLALIHAYKQALSTIKAVNHSPNPRPQHMMTKPDPPPPSSPAQGLSPYTSPSPSSSTSSLSSPAPTPHQQNASDAYDYASAPLMMFSEIFTMNDRFASNAVMNSINLLSALFTPFLDRLLPHLLYKHVLSPPNLLHLLRLSTSTLFPNGYPAPPPQIPTQAEQAQLRLTLLRRLADIAEKSSLTGPAGSSGSRAGMGRGLLGRVLLGKGREEREEVIGGVLDGLGDRVCNTHLVVFLLDAVVLRVFPELGVGGGGDHIQGRDAMLSPEEMSRSVSGATAHTPPSEFVVL